VRLHRYDSGSREGEDRGRDLGHRWSEPIGAAVTAYRSHFRGLGLEDATVERIADASLAALDDWCSPLAAEIAAVASGAGRPVGDLAMLNARTEILARAPRPGEGECSTAVRLPTQGRRPVAFQTWDWNVDLAEHGLLWRYELAPERWVKTFTEFGMLAKIGVNSAGLAVHFNLLHHESDTDGGGVPVHAVARRILDETSTVDEAYDLARSARVGASTVITVVASSPTMAAGSLEISPAGTALVAPGADGWLTHTNHFLAPELADGDRPPAVSTTHARLAHLDKVVSDDIVADDLPGLARGMCGPAGAGAAICMTGETVAAGVAQSTTLLTVRLDPLAGELECWPGTPYEAATVDEPIRF
jgi:isopenicillin-N N-acyltransferase like protein